MEPESDSDDAETHSGAAAVAATRDNTAEPDMPAVFRVKLAWMEGDLSSSAGNKTDQQHSLSPSASNNMEQQHPIGICSTVPRTTRPWRLLLSDET